MVRREHFLVLENLNYSKLNLQEKMASADFYKEAKSIHEFTVVDSFGNDVSLDKYKGNVVLIVNIASNCGLTKNNYAKLTELKTKYYDEGKWKRCLNQKYKIFIENILPTKRIRSPYIVVSL